MDLMATIGKYRFIGYEAFCTLKTALFDKFENKLLFLIKKHLYVKPKPKKNDAITT